LWNAIRTNFWRAKSQRSRRPGLLDGRIRLGSPLAHPNK
jgi:hypothetical protein